MKKPDPLRVGRLQGRRVLLRPFRDRDFALVWAARRRDTSPTMSVSRSAREHLRRRLRRSGQLVMGSLDLAIVASGRLVGDIQARQPRHAIPPGVFELGIALFDPRDRGQGYGTEAVQLLTGWLFDHAGAGRVQAGTALTNVAMRRTLEKLGFSFEGVMRAFMPVPSGREDYALYAVTAEDWPTRSRR